MISIVITSYNEGRNIADTIKAVKETTTDYELIVVDDGSTDRSCDNLEATHVARHRRRIGVGPSRLTGAAYATGDCLIILDAHEFPSVGALNTIAETALSHQAVVWPCIDGVEGRHRDRGHGSFLQPCRAEVKLGGIGNHWVSPKPRDTLVRSFGLFVPYAVPMSVWPKVRYHDGMQGRGSTEPTLAVKAFFTEIDIFHQCGPRVRHIFRGRKNQPRAPYPGRLRDWWNNQALICRICFTEGTWDRYWWPQVFATRVERGEYDTDLVMRQQEAFAKIKKRPDTEFWRGLYHMDPPAGVTD